MELTPEEIKTEIIEELYFLTSYQDLISKMDWTSNHEQQLIELLKNDEIKQLTFYENDFEQTKNLDTLNMAKYWYLATKKGLLRNLGLT